MTPELDLGEVFTYRLYESPVSAQQYVGNGKPTLVKGHYLQKGRSKEEFCRRMEACSVHDPRGFRSRTKPYFKTKSSVILARLPVLQPEAAAL